jgi:hypothetical protein
MSSVSPSPAGLVASVNVESTGTIRTVCVVERPTEFVAVK